MLSTKKKDESEDEKNTLDITGFFTKRDAKEEKSVEKNNASEKPEKSKA
ncbi:MAG TPA: hypothetical protein VFM82_04425 [Flavobacteriaceae bacterium]|nr:hypothetical protein [Flavobacteriaceae bacterium]